MVEEFGYHTKTMGIKFLRGYVSQGKYWVKPLN